MSSPNLLNLIVTFLPSMPTVLMAVSSVAAIVQSSNLSEAQKDDAVDALLLSAINNVTFPTGFFGELEKQAALTVAPALAKALVANAEKLLPPLSAPSPV